MVLEGGCMKDAWKQTVIVLCVLGVLCAATVLPAIAMELTVIMPGGQSVKVTVEPQDTVEQFKKKVYSISELSPLNQVVYKGDQELDRKRTLSSYNIKDGDTLTVKHGVIGAPTRKSDSGTLWVILGFLIIIGSGIFFMRKKPTQDDTVR